jgi:Icc-related predicted phosphoesterase
MKVVAISDLHGYLPEIPECDLLLIAGDICPVTNHKLFFQKFWLKTVFADWVKAQPAKYVVACWGNHDWIGVEEPHPHAPCCCSFLTDECAEIRHYGTYRIYGMPWQKRFCDWAFNLDEPQLSMKYEAIPDGVDIIISHGPAYGYGDKTPRERTGSMAFLKRIDEIKPKLVVTGHIHCDPGIWKRGDTIICNATLLDDNYRVANEPRVFEI